MTARIGFVHGRLRVLRKRQGTSWRMGSAGSFEYYWTHNIDLHEGQEQIARSIRLDTTDYNLLATAKKL